MGAEAPLYDVIPNHRYRFIDFVGEGFLLGGACGSAFYFTRGLRRSSPAAVGGSRLAAAAHAARANAPRIAGWFGAYSALFCALEMSMARVRRKDDPWNSIAAGAGALGLFDLRRGGRYAAVSALFGAATVAVICGADWVVGEWDSRFASEPATTRTNNAGPLAPAIIPRHTDSQGSVDASTPSETHLELLDNSTKLLLDEMRKGFHSSVLENRLSAGP